MTPTQRAEIRAKAEKQARDIMDNACLGETFANNGVIAALTQTIADALGAAEARVEAVRQDALEAAAQIADGFTCGGCGMDGKAAKAIRLLTKVPASPTQEGDGG